MMELPKPGAEHAKLMRFAGTWSGDEQLSESPWGPGGAARGRCENRSAVDGMAMVQDYSEEKGGQTVFRGHGVFSIDPANGDVLWWWFDSMGRRSLLTDRYVFKTTAFVIGALIAALMVGGNSFELSKFNRATQAFRQVGSSFKPFVYTTAIDRGYTPVSILQDTPVTYPGGPGQPPYSPHNYENDFWGPITLRRALEHSRNVPAIKLMDALGPKQVIAYARRFGLTAPLPPYLPIALGAGDETLLEMTSAYSVFPNQGVRMTPYSILKVTDREGNLLEENRPEPQDAIRADTAFVMISLLRGVVEHGTAVKAASIDWPIAGKTGTTDDFSDAWFIGFDPDLTLGVWVGYDQKKPLGSGMSGAEAALPIWINIFKTWIGDRKDPPKFEPPGNIVFVAIDKTTGLPVEDMAGAFNEAFIAGTQPGSIR